MNFNIEPFSRYSARRTWQQAKTLAQRANEKLKKRLINPEKLMYDYESGGIKIEKTGDFFSGKFVIPADKFERIVKVCNGQEVSNLVRLKSGENFSLEIVGHKPKYFTTKLSANDKQAETKKMIDADQKMYDNFVERFANTKKQ